MKLLSFSRLKVEKLLIKFCKKFGCPKPTFDKMRLVDVDNNVGKIKLCCFKTIFIASSGKSYNIVLMGYLCKDWCVFGILPEYYGGSILLHKYLGKPEEALEIIFNNAKRYL